MRAPMPVGRLERQRWWVLVAAFLAFPGTLRAQPVLSEIHYHPPAPFGGELEFVEIHNPGDETVDLSGWFFAAGIEFVFPQGAMLPPGGYVVVCKNRDAFVEHFGPDARLYGNYSDSLDNGGEDVALADRFGAVIDVVPYLDSHPWPPLADGEGASLSRRCAEAPSHWPENWSGDAVSGPSPFEPAGDAGCPIERSPAPRVVFSEIHYHPSLDRDADEEYIELANITDAPVDLSGWRFGDGIQFHFEAGTIIGPGERLVVCRNVEHIRTTFQIDNVVGPFGGKLSNLRDRLSLLDQNGHLVDAIHYRDQGDWPYPADGLGRSLEKVALDQPSHDPANWIHSGVRDDENFLRVEAVGPIDPLLIQRLILGIAGPGEVIIDDISLERIDEPGVNLVVNGDFESEGMEPWEPRGIASSSVVEDGIGVDESRALRVISSGSCEDDCASIDSVSQTFARGALDSSVMYRLSLSFRHVRGSSEIYARLLRGVSVRFDVNQLSPGAPNSREQETMPPLVHWHGRYPEMPESTDPVWLSVRVRAEGSPVSSVRLAWRRDAQGAAETVVEMADDGQGRDSFAGDGVYGVELPPQPHGTPILYRVIVEGEDGVEWSFPRPFHDDEILPHEYWGYYVYDDLPDSELPIYHLIIPGVDPTNPRDVNNVLDCTNLTAASFAYRGELYPQIGVRWRGNTACWIQKRNFKLRFQRGRDFRGARKWNLQGLWTDKSLLREHLAWRFMEEIGAPAVDTEYVRVHLNGQYHGLFLLLEHPDQRWLRRIGLDPDGCLYKALQPPAGGGTPQGFRLFSTLEEYERAWERETCEAMDYMELSDFIGDLHSAEGLTADFMIDRTYPEWTITYQIAQTVLNNIDSFAKNHFVYRDGEEGKWGIIGWDMDLTFGKFFSLQVVDRFPDGERPVGTLNDCMLSDPRIAGDLNPWFSTQVNQNPLLHHFVNRFFIAEGGYFQRAYLVRLWNVLQEKFSNDNLDPIIDELAAFLESEATDDLARWGRYKSNPECPVPDAMGPNVEILKGQVTLHRAYMINYLRTFHRSVTNTPRLQITEIMYDPEGSGSDLEFIEIINHSEEEIDLTDWGLTGGVEFAFPMGATLPPGEVAVIVKDPVLFGQRYPTLPGSTRIFGPFFGDLADGEEIRLIDAGPGWPATLDRVHYRTHAPWPELRDGYSIELIDPLAAIDNDSGTRWRSSPVLGGTPGTLGPVSGIFVRGDFDGSSVTNLTDAIGMLGYLFLSGDPPSCPDAADVDDDGSLLLNDPIYLLNYLFLSGSMPPAPHPTPGVDPTPDGFDC